MITENDLVTVDLVRLDYLFSEVSRQIENEDYTTSLIAIKENPLFEEPENAITIYGDGIWESVYIDENGYRELHHIDAKLGQLDLEDYEIRKALEVVRFLPERSYTVMLDQ